MSDEYKNPNYNCDECCNKPKLMDRLKKIINFVKPVSIALICLMCTFGIVGFFIASIIVDSVTLDTFNGFISIVLGIVALTASIVSMLLSFYSIEKAEESDKELNKMLQEMKHIQSNTETIVSKIEEKTNEMNENVKQSLKNTESKEVNQNDGWKELNNNGTSISK